MARPGPWARCFTAMERRGACPKEMRLVEASIDWPESLSRNSIGAYHRSSRDPIRAPIRAHDTMAPPYNTAVASTDTVG